MDKTNVTVKLTGRLLSEKENFVDIDEQQLVDRLIELLRSRKNLVNVSFQSGAQATNRPSTVTKIEILLADEHGAFSYYED